MRKWNAVVAGIESAVISDQRTACGDKRPNTSGKASLAPHCHGTCLYGRHPQAVYRGVFGFCTREYVARRRTEASGVQPCLLYAAIAAQAPLVTRHTMLAKHRLASRLHACALRTNSSRAAAVACRVRNIDQPEAIFFDCDGVVRPLVYSRTGRNGCVAVFMASAGGRVSRLSVAVG